MMLLYKAWRESQVRFLTAVLALAGYCVFIAESEVQMRGSFSKVFLGGQYSTYVENLAFDGIGRTIFVVLVMVLALGGLLRERAHRTAAFTLALPVSRSRLVGAQIAIGLAEVALLALLPAMLIPALAKVVGQSYPMEQALRFCVLWFIGGTVIFAASYLLSVVLRGEYTPPVVCFGALMLIGRVSGERPLRQYHLNILRTMGARWDWLPTSMRQVHDPLPWKILLAMLLVAILIFAIAARITERQEL